MHLAALQPSDELCRLLAALCQGATHDWFHAWSAPPFPP